MKMNHTPAHCRCYNNEPHAPHRRSRAEPAPVQTGAGTHPRSLPQIMWQRRIPRPIFIPLCGLRKAMVIPAQSLPPSSRGRESIPLFPIPRYGARAPEPVEILRLPPPARVENTSASARWSGQRSLRVYCALAPRAELRPAAWGCGANGRGRASGGREAAG